MNKDQDIKQLFSQIPAPCPKEDFMRELDRTMQVVDIVRGERNRVARFYRIFALTCFAIGLLSGISLLYVTVCHPVDWGNILASLPNISPHLLAFCLQYGKLGMSIIACGLILLGMWPILTIDTGFHLAAIHFTRKKLN